MHALQYCEYASRRSTKSQLSLLSLSQIVITKLCTVTTVQPFCRTVRLKCSFIHW